jgi:hypothetical protein
MMTLLSYENYDRQQEVLITSAAMVGINKFHQTFSWWIWLRISPTYKMAKRTIIPTLNDIINKSGLMVSHNKTDSEYIIHNWGGRFWLGSGDDPDSLRGPNLAWVGIDEPFIQKKMVLDIALSRIRVGEEKNRELFLTGTPEELNWGYDLCMNDEGHYDIGYVVGKTADNFHNGPEFIKMMENAYTPEMREAYLEGKFINMKQGRAYKPFDRDRHIKKMDISNLEICAGIDFNVDYMSAEIFANGNGFMHFFDEIRLSYSNTFELSDELRKRYPGIRCFPDPTGSGRRTSATKSDHQILQDAGIRVYFRERQIPVMDRVNAVNLLLSKDRLTIEPGKCDWLIRDLERVVFKSGDLDKTSDPALTHSSDGAGYAAHYLYPILKRTTEQVRI